MTEVIAATSFCTAKTKIKNDSQGDLSIDAI
jgi:hypothetical protein